MTLLIGKTEASPGYFQDGSPESSLLSGVRAKTELDVVFRAVSAIVFFTTCLSRCCL
jgi:hypothetical protein